ncbi:NADH:flavin oxidoreductase [Capsaspora owczarzaki ATCC 30864]|uniref:NADH:flavin oxidoreductase n=1 Tax=Capsaspora owczarzaki (strain ATCC 30864) TaxID=595528 RepID=A0A0D2VPX4_CAPO3|nr:NADH:flavin oxidoreductase [Capsaspora owczarzaki ATCC 30864]KJE92572.1 NADH:flavin oxidoreductase [Capsaspora owczarzaki ATCC 30864]|eukprot:XP_004348419.1 NADH:flavin oxidoreductase [Capsaspora owczarzaki ATCC 30864]
MSTTTTTAAVKAPQTIPGSDIPTLLTPIQLGSSATLAHRVVLPPLTRRRASFGGTPNVELSGRYYAQRATAGGLLIAEATNITAQGQGYPSTPGIFKEQHVEAWRRITDRVHAVNKNKTSSDSVSASNAAPAVFYLQLWHVGRVSFAEYQPDGRAQVAPSAVAIPNTNGMLPDGTATPHTVPRALEISEIDAIVDDYAKATVNARRAGFDGVEIHGANGYLIDQFLHAGSNTRQDEYGGSIENRARFLFRVVEAVIAAWKSGNDPADNTHSVGLRLAPFGTFLAMSDPNEDELFSYVIERLNQYNLSFLHLIEPRVAGNQTCSEVEETVVLDKYVHLYKGPIIAAGGFQPAAAERICSAYAKQGHAVAVAFGRSFISTPDLPRRLLLRAELSPYNRATFYTNDHIGYTDQSPLSESEVEQHLDLLSKSRGIDDLRALNLALSPIGV